MERLKAELEAIGFYLSSHPLDAYGPRLRRLQVVPSANLPERQQSGTVTLAGTVIGRKERTSGKGNRFAFVQLSDASGVYEITVFSELLASRREMIEAGKSLLIRANVQVDGESVRCTAQDIELLDVAVNRLSTTIEICIDAPEPLAALHEVVREHAGGKALVKLLPWLGAGNEAEILLPLRCRATPEMLQRLRAIPGVREVREG